MLGRRVGTATPVTIVVAALLLGLGTVEASAISSATSVGAGCAAGDAFAGCAAGLQESLSSPLEQTQEDVGPGGVGTPDDTGSSGGIPAPTAPLRGPMVDGGSATTNGAAESEAPASSAPTPPNGAEPAAAGSPAPVVTSQGAAPPESPEQPEPVAAPPEGQTGGAGGLLDLIARSGQPAAAEGLTPDGTRSGALVALLAFVVLLFLVAHQFLDRRDPRLGSMHDTDGIAQFR